ncbi:MAG: glycosyl hydrolase family 18 protein [Ilumatobacteraceae bacterium]
MVERRRWAALAAAAVLSLTGVTPAAAASPRVGAASAANRFVTGWIPYWMAQSGTAVLTGTTSAPLVSEVSVMGYSQDLVSLSSNVTSIGNATRAAGLPLIPTVFGPRTDVLDPAKVTAHAQAIADLVKAKGYDGIDIDYEFVWSVPKSDWPTLRTRWVAFVKLLAGKLHAQGKILSVTVPPVWNSGSSGYWVYDQPAIAPHVDRLRLMVYDWSISNPGNIAPSYWVNSVISYSTDTAKVPPKKLQLGVPTYGRHWWTKKVSSEVCPDGALKKVDSVMQKEVAALVAGKAANATRVNGEMKYTWDEQVTGLSELPPPYDPVVGGLLGVVGAAKRAGLVPAVRLGAPRTVTCTVQHVVYVPDAVTIVSNATAALARGWSGITMWTFGYERSDVWDALAAVSPQRAAGAPAVTVAPITSSVLATGKRSVTVTGTAFDPQWDLPRAVRIDLKQGTSVIGTSTVLANRTTTLAASLAGIGPFHGYVRAIVVPAGTYTVCATALRWGGGDLAQRCTTYTAT